MYLTKHISLYLPTSGLRALQAFRARSHLARKDMPLRAIMEYEAAQSSNPVANTQNQPVKASSGVKSGAQATTRKSVNPSEKKIPASRGTDPAYNPTLASVNQTGLTSDEEILYDIHVQRHALRTTNPHNSIVYTSQPNAISGPTAPAFLRRPAHNSFPAKQASSSLSSTTQGSRTSNAFPDTETMKSTGTTRTRVTVRPSRVRIGLQNTLTNTQITAGGGGMNSSNGASIMSSSAEAPLNQTFGRSDYVNGFNGGEANPQATTSQLNNSVADNKIEANDASLSDLVSDNHLPSDSNLSVADTTPGPSRRALRVASGGVTAAATNLGPGNHSTVRPPSGTPVKSRSFTPRDPTRTQSHSDNPESITNSLRAPSPPAQDGPPVNASAVNMMSMEGGDHPGYGEWNSQRKTGGNLAAPADANTPWFDQY